MNFITMYKSILAIAVIGIFTMCKSDLKSAETTNETKSEKAVSIGVAVDSSMVDFTRTIDLQ